MIEQDRLTDDCPPATDRPWHVLDTDHVVRALARIKPAGSLRKKPGAAMLSDERYRRRRKSLLREIYDFD